MPLRVAQPVLPQQIRYIPFPGLVAVDSRALDESADLFGRLETSLAGPLAVRVSPPCIPGKTAGEMMERSPSVQATRLVDQVIVLVAHPACERGFLHRQCVTCFPPPPGGKSWSIRVVIGVDFEYVTLEISLGGRYGSYLYVMGVKHGLSGS